MRQRERNGRTRAHDELHCLRPPAPARVRTTTTVHERAGLGRDTRMHTAARAAAGVSPEDRAESDKLCAQQVCAERQLLVAHTHARVHSGGRHRSGGGRGRAGAGVRERGERAHSAELDASPEFEQIAAPETLHAQT